MTDLPRVLDILARPGAPEDLRLRVLQRWPDRQPRSGADERAMVQRLADEYLRLPRIQHLRRFPKGFVVSAHRGAYEATRQHLERLAARLERTRDDAVGKIKRRAAKLRADPGSFEESAAGPNTSVALTAAAEADWQDFLKRIAVANDDGSSLLGIAAHLRDEVEDALKATRLGVEGLLDRAAPAEASGLVPALRLDNITVAIARVREEKVRPSVLSGFRSSVSLVLAPVSITVTFLVRVGLKPGEFVLAHAWPWAAGAALVVGASALVARAALASQRHELGERLRDGLVNRLRDDAIAEVMRMAQRLEARRQELADEVLHRLNTWAEEDEQLWLDAEHLAAWRRSA